MGMLSPRQEPETNLLRLSGTTGHRMPRDIRQEMERNIGTDNARKEVINNRVVNFTEVADLAIMATTYLTNRAESAAVAVPEERARIDAITDLANGLIQKAMTELGR